jgi:hypothetical protein
MAVTFIEYQNNKGFYIHEDYIQLVFMYIYPEMQKSQYNFTNKVDLLYDCKSIVNGIRSGYLGLTWHNYLTGSADEQLMIQLLQNVVSILQTKGEYISVSELQSLPTEDSHWLRLMDKNFPVNELIKIFNALTEMLQGTWTSLNYDMTIDW